jgi:hypothetical protein
MNTARQYMGMLTAAIAISAADLQQVNPEEQLVELKIYIQHTNKQLAFSARLNISRNDICKNTEIYTKGETNVKF